MKILGFASCNCFLCFTELTQHQNFHRSRNEPRLFSASSTAEHDEQLCDLGRGMSRSDFMLRQRYVENSGHKDSCCRSISVASHPAEPKLKSSVDVRNFVKEQRKIISNFKAQPWPMQVKMAARKAYQNNLTKYADEMNAVDSLRDTLQMVGKRLRCRWNNFIDYITIWGSIIKQIEGHFGSSVASFFSFLRWLCALNLIVTTLVFGFLIVPQRLAGHGLDVPQSVKRNGSAFSFFLDGKGYEFEYSVLFYGYYDSGKIEPHTAPPHNPDPEIGWGYKLPLAYLLIVVAIFSICIMATLTDMAKQYKVLQRANVSEQYLFAWKIFASWDYTITNRETAVGKARQITVALKETVLEAEKVFNKGTKWHMVFIRAISQAIIGMVLLASCYAIYLAVEETKSYSSNKTLSQAIDAGSDGLLMLIKTFQVQLVILGRNMILPYIFKASEMLEKHHPRTALKILLIRLFLMYVSSLYVLIIALMTISKQCHPDDASSSNSTASETSSLLSSLTFKKSTGGAGSSQGGGGGDEICCWETTIGQELFKLSITHFLAELLKIFFNDVIRWAIVQSKFSPRFDKLVGLADFTLAENILRLVYGQALIWLGVLFCPLLPAINFMKLVLLFYIRAIVVSIFNRPPRTMFRVASTRNFYMALLLVMTFLCIFPVGYAMIQISPSTHCGPFRGLPSMLKILMYEIDTWPSLLRKIISNLQTATIIIPGMVMLLIVIFYYKTLVGALKEVNKDLRLQLHMEQQETKERLIKDAQEQGVSPRPSSTMKNRHKELVIRIKGLEEEQEQSSQQPSPVPSSPPPSPSPFRREKRVRVREVEDDDDISSDTVPFSPSDLETGWSPLPNSTVGFVDTKRGATIRQTTL